MLNKTDTNTDNIKFSEKTLERVQQLIKRYPEGKQKSALLPVLHIAQEEFGGWLSPEVMDYVAELLSLQSIEVYEVATFYTMYALKPTGKFVLEVCRTGPCCLLGAEKMITYLEKKLEIKVGETTQDGLFTIKTVECLASCGSAPMMQIGEAYRENLTEEKMDLLLQQLRDLASAKSTGKMELSQT